MCCFFFKQKTAYEMRISDWSSDVCSSDLKQHRCSGQGMNLQSRPLRQVTEIENTFITLSDGCRLAARIWLPQDAEQHPVPAVLEYLPYRKRDSTAPRDESTHPLAAARGYACVRLVSAEAGRGGKEWVGKGR